MAENSLYFNSKYHISRPNSAPLNIWSSFSIFKVNKSSTLRNVDERPPYPIILAKSSFYDIFYNINKSDLAVYLAITSYGFAVSFWATREYMNLESKLYLHKRYMGLFSLIAVSAALSCSHARLSGYLDNGLRWKEPYTHFEKFDLTGDYEANSIFKHLRNKDY